MLLPQPSPTHNWSGYTYPTLLFRTRWTSFTSKLVHSKYISDWSKFLSDSNFNNMKNLLPVPRKNVLPVVLLSKLYMAATTTGTATTRTTTAIYSGQTLTEQRMIYCTAEDEDEEDTMETRVLSIGAQRLEPGSQPSSQRNPTQQNAETRRKLRVGPKE